LRDKTVYDELVDLWRQERGSKTPVKIPEEWVGRLREYAEGLRVRLRLAVDRGSINSKLCERELEVVSTLVSDLLYTRLEKIVRAAMEGELVENLIPAEARLQDNLYKILAAYREFIEHSSSTLDLSRGALESVERVVVAFLKDVPAIVDSDGVARGPFKAGSIAALDHRTADLLERRGLARRLPLMRG